MVRQKKASSYEVKACAWLLDPVCFEANSTPEERNKILLFYCPGNKRSTRNDVVIYDGTSLCIVKDQQDKADEHLKTWKKHVELDALEPNTPEPEKKHVKKESVAAKRPRNSSSSDHDELPYSLSSILCDKCNKWRFEPDEFIGSDEGNVYHCQRCSAPDEFNALENGTMPLEKFIHLKTNITGMFVAEDAGLADGGDGSNGDGGDGSDGGGGSKCLTGKKHIDMSDAELSLQQGPPPVVVSGRPKRFRAEHPPKPVCVQWGCNHRDGYDGSTHFIEHVIEKTTTITAEEEGNDAAVVNDGHHGIHCPRGTAHPAFMQDIKTAAGKIRPAAPSVTTVSRPLVPPKQRHNPLKRVYENPHSLHLVEGNAPFFKLHAESLKLHVESLKLHVEEPPHPTTQDPSHAVIADEKIPSGSYVGDVRAYIGTMTASVYQQATERLAPPDREFLRLGEPFFYTWIPEHGYLMGFLLGGVVRKGGPWKTSALNPKNIMSAVKTTHIRSQSFGSGDYVGNVVLAATGELCPHCGTKWPCLSMQATRDIQPGEEIVCVIPDKKTVSPKFWGLPTDRVSLYCPVYTKKDGAHHVYPPGAPGKMIKHLVDQGRYDPKKPSPVVGRREIDWRIKLDRAYYSVSKSVFGGASGGASGGTLHKSPKK